MNVKTNFFRFNGAVLHYAVRGRGEKVLLSFHGYGQSNSSFETLDKELSDEFTIYSFDLFFHGNSFWHKRDEVLSKEFWKNLLDAFLVDKGIRYFSVLGFSMGGKFALAVVESFPKRVERLILIAPDGIKINTWYKLATKSYLTRSLLRKLILSPKIYHKLVKVIQAIKFVDKGVLRFANSQMRTLKDRRKVYHSWVVFRSLRFEVKKMASLINKNNIQLQVFLGHYDKIVTRKHLEVFLKKVNNAEVHILNSGHTNLIDAVADFYRRS